MGNPYPFPIIQNDPNVGLRFARLTSDITNNIINAREKAKRTGLYAERNDLYRQNIENDRAYNELKSRIAYERLLFEANKARNKQGLDFVEKGMSLGDKRYPMSMRKRGYQLVRQGLEQLGFDTSELTPDLDAFAQMTKKLEFAKSKVEKGEMSQSNFYQFLSGLISEYKSASPEDLSNVWKSGQDYIKSRPKPQTITRMENGQPVIRELIPRGGRLKVGGYLGKAPTKATSKKPEPPPGFWKDIVKAQVAVANGAPALKMYQALRSKYPKFQKQVKQAIIDPAALPDNVLKDVQDAAGRIRAGENQANVIREILSKPTNAPYAKTIKFLLNLPVRVGELDMSEIIKQMK